MTAGTDAGNLAEGGLTWLPGAADDIGKGLVWRGSGDDDVLDPTLYSGPPASSWVLNH